MKIRKATKKDAKAISEIYKKVYSEKPYLELWKDEVILEKINENLKWQKIFVAEDNGNIIGFIFCYTFLWWNGMRGYIEDFGILKEYRGKGVGKKLLRYAEDKMKELNVNLIWLDVNKKAIVAKKLYKKRGYRDSGYIKLEKKLK